MDMLLMALASLAGRIVGSALDPVNWIIAGAVGATERTRKWRWLAGIVFAIVRTAFVAWRSPERPPIDLALYFIAYLLLFWLIAGIVAWIAALVQRRNVATTQAD